MCQACLKVRQPGVATSQRPVWDCCLEDLLECFIPGSCEDCTSRVNNVATNLVVAYYKITVENNGTNEYHLIAF